MIINKYLVKLLIGFLIYKLIKRYYTLLTFVDYPRDDYGHWSDSATVISRLLALTSAVNVLPKFLSLITYCDISMHFT